MLLSSTTMAQESQPQIDPELAALGARLRSLRSSRGWTLEELAERSGLSKAFLSRLEAGSRHPSIAAVLTLARVYDVAMASFFEQAAAADSVQVVRGAELPLLSGNGVTYAPMSGNNSRFNLQPIRMVISASRQGNDRYHHEGEEWLYVLSGQLRLRLADKEYQLQPGDAAHFDSRLPHRLEALGNADATVILVACSTPTSLHSRRELTALTAGLAG